MLWTEFKKFTRDTSRPTSASSVAHDVSSQAEANQVNVVPAASKVAHQPGEESAEVLSDTGNISYNHVVDAAGSVTPVDDNNVGVGNGQVFPSDEGVHSRSTLAVISMDNDHCGTAAIEVRAANRVSVVINQSLVVSWVASEINMDLYFFCIAMYKSKFTRYK